ncbi:restriction endonuclease subunit S [Aequorivita sp. F47161]|uniref:Restriction endonuclease subunit S n=1 Tax=Aequorivita vitellina TaxID=2874475 RepID=A0A9X1QW99_9FLAO|nr:restriction endonuclease subunit S [Aequorivita vitellina]MCG2420083.1 restriction endonuclease subunit S [Aequorivita vitellina]
MTSKKTVLKSIIKPGGIASGYSFRGKINGSPKGNLRVVQLKDMENEYTSIGNDCTFIDAAEVKEKYYLEKGDILFISKGANNFATVFELDDVLPSVASSVFYVIKVDALKAEPNFVAWYINKSKVQQYFQEYAVGTYSLSINKEVVENIPLQLPPLEIQIKIAKVAMLAQKEQYIYKSLKEKRNQLLEAQLLESIN